MEENKVFQVNGFIGILAIVILLGLSAFMFINQSIGMAILLIVITILSGLHGITIVQPNQAIVVTFLEVI